jgi:dihydroorotate dehydrogenase (NAD+) catalytic subunit
VGRDKKAVRVGTVTLRNPVMTASGTAGYGTELARSFDLAEIGAVVVKSLAAFEWAGNAAPRLHPTTAGMINAVGLQGPGVPYWLDHVLPDLLATGATVVASIWGRSVDEYREAARQLAAAPGGVVAVEVNLSCPNLHAPGGDVRDAMFAHHPDQAAAVVAAVVAEAGRPCWAKLSPNTDRVVAVARAVHDAGAEAVTCINTILAMAYDRASGAPSLAAGGGGLSGPAIHPIAVRVVHDVAAAVPSVAVIGAGGVTDEWTAREMLLAGAAAVQVGTATFADPKAPWRVAKALAR